MKKDTNNSNKNGGIYKNSSESNAKINFFYETSKGIAYKNKFPVNYGRNINFIIFKIFNIFFNLYYFSCPLKEISQA